MSVLSPVSATDGWFAGEDQDFQFTISDSTGAAQDITGWTISWVLTPPSGGAAVLTKAATLTTPASGICTVVTARADTQALPAGTYTYQLSRTDTGQNQVLAYGAAVLQARGA